MLTSHQKSLLTVISVAGLALTAPLEILHALVWIAFHAYELFEFILDEAIHHVFHTSRHVTQVIVFYLMAGMCLYGVYRLVKGVKGVYSKEKIGFPKELAKQKEQVAELFKQLPLSKTTQMIFGLTFSVAFLAIAVF